MMVRVVEPEQRYGVVDVEMDDNALMKAVLGARRLADSFGSWLAKRRDRAPRSFMVLTMLVFLASIVIVAKSVSKDLLYVHVGTDTLLT